MAAAQPELVVILVQQVQAAAVRLIQVVTEILVVLYPVVAVEQTLEAAQDVILGLNQVVQRAVAASLL